MIILNTANKIIMDSLNILKKLESKPVFRVQDIERLCVCDRGYARQILYRLKEKGHIRRVSENIYTTSDDIYSIASNIVTPSYISFFSASYYLGYTEQIVNTIQVASTENKKEIRFEHYKIEFVKMKHFFGYRKIRTSKGDIFVSEDEKLLIDIFLKSGKAGNFDEIKKVFENSKISKEKISEYLKRVNSQAITKRVGYLLEAMRGIDIAKDFSLDNNYVFLNPFSKTGKHSVGKWRVKI
jgi:predicted transcriptional regulator of viral defense system